MPTQAQGIVLPGSADRLNLARRMPLGVVGVISPFNFPLYLALRAVAPAIAVGNAVVLKPDPRTAICSGFRYRPVCLSWPACRKACCRSFPETAPPAQSSAKTPTWR